MAGPLQLGTSGVIICRDPLSSVLDCGDFTNGGVF